MIKLLKPLLLTGLLLPPLLWSTAASANDLMMVRLAMKADIALEYVKTSIIEHEYIIAHEQLCDGGMTGFGYKTDTYRVLFFGKGDEIRMLSDKHPDIVSYLPLKMTVVAEKDETLLSILDPEFLAPYYNDRDTRIIFQRWKNDIRSIFNDVRRGVEQHGKTEKNQLVKHQSDLSQPAQ